ncbi:hypothetical protein ACTXT7_007913 [Hymenolepis weldensis]
MEKNFPPPTPNLTVEAIKNAVLRLYCLEDISVVGKLGSGFYANVYLVYHRPTKRKMALKISPSGNIQRREIELLRGLRHENVQRLTIFNIIWCLHNQWEISVLNRKYRRGTGISGGIREFVELSSECVKGALVIMSEVVGSISIGAHPTLNLLILLSAILSRGAYNKIMKIEVPLLLHMIHFKQHPSLSLTFYFTCALQYANGGSLVDLLTATSSPLPWGCRVSLAHDIIRGLGHLHEHRLIHRDLSSQIFRHPRQKSVLTEFIPREFSRPFSPEFHMRFKLILLQNNPNIRIHPTDLYASNALNRCAGVNLRLVIPLEEFPICPSNGQQNLVQNILIRVNYEASGTAMPLPPNWGCNRSNGTTTPIPPVENSPSQLEPSQGLRIDQMTELWEPGSPPCAGLPKVSPSLAPPSSFHRYSRLPPYIAVVGDLGVCLDLRQLSSNNETSTWIQRIRVAEGSLIVSIFSHPVYKTKRPVITRNVDATVIAGSAYCTAPECLRKLAPYSPAADIFAYGLLVCELIARVVNNGSAIPRTSDFGLDKENLCVPDDCPQWFLDLAVDCCKVNHLERPSAKEIVDRIISRSMDPSFIGPRAFNYNFFEEDTSPDRSSLKCFTGPTLRGNGGQQLPAPATIQPDCLG